MKQLLIVNKAKGMNSKGDAGGANITPYNLSNLAEGSICFYETDSNSIIGTSNTTQPTKDFSIALGRANSPAFVIPEINVETLEITKTLPQVGTKFSAYFTVPTTVVGKEYTVILVKKGAVPHERNTWSATVRANSTTATDVATALKTQFDNMFEASGMNITVTRSSAQLTIAATDYQDYELKLADTLSGVSVTTSSHGKKPVGDKAYILDLASRCAAGKGFDSLYGEGKELYPGYPEVVEDLTPAYDTSTPPVPTEGYAIYNLHFATRRKSGKQLDELVWQYVHIAVPVSTSTASAIDAVLPVGKFNVLNGTVADLDSRVTALEDA